MVRCPIACYCWYLKDKTFVARNQSVPVSTVSYSTPVPLLSSHDSIPFSTSALHGYSHPDHGTSQLGIVDRPLPASLRGVHLPNHDEKEWKRMKKNEKEW